MYIQSFTPAYKRYRWSWVINFTNLVLILYTNFMCGLFCSLLQPFIKCSLGRRERIIGDFLAWACPFFRFSIGSFQCAMVFGLLHFSLTFELLPVAQNTPAYNIHQQRATNTHSTCTHLCIYRSSPKFSRRWSSADRFQVAGTVAVCWWSHWNHLPLRRKGNLIAG